MRQRREGVYTRNAIQFGGGANARIRVRLANRVLALYGMRLSDWQGTSFLLSTSPGRARSSRTSVISGRRRRSCPAEFATARA